VSSSSEALTADARAMATPRLAGGPFNVYAATETAGSPARCTHDNELRILVGEERFVGGDVWRTRWRLLVDSVAWPYAPAPIAISRRARYRR
jgi:hypothetical protein